MPAIPSMSDVEAAARRIEPYAVHTPLLRSAALDARTGGTILLKAETLQRIGAFKFRGAFNKISQIDRGEFPGGVVACSSGNHAQGVAAASTICGLSSVVVMPADAPSLKIDRTRRFGSEVVLYDRVKEDRDAIASRLCEERRAAFVHPFDDPDVIAGQGTVGLELIAQAKDMGLTPDVVIACCSGGGLVSGISIAVKAVNKATEVMSAEPAEFDDFARSLESGQREKNPKKSGSICDALMSERPGRITFDLAKKNISKGLAVTDAEAAEAVRFAFEELKLVVEPGGAVALAAVLAGKLPTKGRTIAVVLSGGNVDPALFSRIMAGKAN